MIFIRSCSLNVGSSSALDINKAAPVINHHVPRERCEMENTSRSPAKKQATAKYRWARNTRFRSTTLRCCDEDGSQGDFSIP